MKMLTKFFNVGLQQCRKGQLFTFNRQRESNGLATPTRLSTGELATLSISSNHFKIVPSTRVNSSIRQYFIAFEDQAKPSKIVKSVMKWWSKCISMVIAKTGSRNVAFNSAKLAGRIRVCRPIRRSNTSNRYGRFIFWRSGF